MKWLQPTRGRHDYVADLGIGLHLSLVKSDDGDWRVSVIRNVNASSYSYCFGVAYFSCKTVNLAQEYAKRVWGRWLHARMADLLKDVWAEPGPPRVNLTEPL